MTYKQTIIDRVDVSGCEYLYTDNRYNDKCCSASISGDSLCKPSEMICVKYVEYLKEQLKHKEQECEKLKATLKVIADRPCLNINDCNGNCLPHCKWNAHKLAQEALKELE